MNECNADPPICGANSQCSNTEGNFTCGCNSGYNWSEIASACEGIFALLEE